MKDNNQQHEQILSVPAIKSLCEMASSETEIHQCQRMITLKNRELHKKSEELAQCAFVKRVNGDILNVQKYIDEAPKEEMEEYLKVQEETERIQEDFKTLSTCRALCVKKIKDIIWNNPNNPQQGQ